MRRETCSFFVNSEDLTATLLPVQHEVVIATIVMCLVFAR